MMLLDISICTPLINGGAYGASFRRKLSPDDAVAFGCRIVEGQRLERAADGVDARFSAARAELCV